MVGLLRGVAKIKRSQKGENIGLKKRHQQLQEKHEYHKEHTTDTYSVSRNSSLLTEYERKAHESKNDDVACSDVGRETHHQYKRLDDDLSGFDRYKDKLDWEWHTGRPENMTPVVFVPADGGQHQHEKRQDSRNGKGTCNVEPADKWNQAKHIAQPDKEERGEQKRHKAIGMATDGWTRNLIADKEDEWLQRILQATRGLTGVALVFASRSSKEDEQQCNHQKHPENTLGNGKVERSGIGQVAIFKAFDGRRSTTVIDRFVMHNEITVLVEGFFHTIYHLLLLVVVEIGRGKYLHAVVGVENNRQINGKITDDVDFMRIGNVVHDHLTRVERAVAASGLNILKRNQGCENSKKRPG